MFVSHLCQHMTAGILSLVTESDANYTITANLTLNAQCCYRGGSSSKASITIRRIRFQKHPGQSGEYHHPSHEGYGPQLFRYPRTQHWSGDLRNARLYISYDIVLLQQVKQTEVRPARALTCQFTDCVGLAAVLAHVGVHKIHNIRANRGPEHSRQDDIFA